MLFELVNIILETETWCYCSWNKLLCHNINWKMFRAC